MVAAMSHKIIAIDGPSASGKGTLARALARHLNYAYLDTGALYRLVAKTLLDDSRDPNDEGRAREAAEKLAITLRPDMLQQSSLRDDAVGQGASIVAKFPSVRDALFNLQRGFAASPLLDNGKPAAGVILDGRDIGTVIAPDADVKLFVTASTEERTRRRLLELQQKGFETDYGTVLADMQARDARDQGRDTAPLKPARDAHIFDTSAMDAKTVFEKALSIIVRS